jgi:hypothetical protein
VIERLDAGTVEEWKAHPATVAFLEGLRAQANDTALALVRRGAAGEEVAAVYAMAGRAQQLFEIIDRIKNAKGKAGE